MTARERNARLTKDVRIFVRMGFSNDISKGVYYIIAYLDSRVYGIELSMETIAKESRQLQRATAAIMELSKITGMRWAMYSADISDDLPYAAHLPEMDVLESSLVLVKLSELGFRVLKNGPRWSP